MHRKKLLADERKVNEEMRRQREIDVMYEVMNAKPEREKAGGNAKDDVTFDY